MVSGPCPYCGCAEIDEDPSRGDAVCTECGAVLDENCIVSEVQFVEDSRGQSRAVGALTNPDGTLHCSLDGRRVGGKSSREITLKNAQRKILTLCSQLRLPSHCSDTALQLYKMALNRKLTKGRRNSHVIAACVYITCRQERTSHMLLDLSDILQVNVYELGRTYSHLSNALNIKPTVIDPSIYCMRFANQLQLGEKTHSVFMTASRIVQRMKKDWMQAGRRPAGLCGAALVVAARRHGFNRTVKDIIKVVKVCSATVRKRLNEFCETPSSRLTLEEFMNIDLEEEQDPPAFRNIRKRKLKELEEPNEDVKQQVEELRKEIEKGLEEERNKKMLTGKYALFTPADGESSNCSFSEQFVLEETLKTINEDLIASAGGECISEEQLNSIIIPDSCHKYLNTAFNNPEKSSTSLRDQSLVTLGIRINTGEPVVSKEKEMADADVQLDLTGLDDTELDTYIMTDNEAKPKIELWIRSNLSYLREHTEKEEKRAREEEENANKPEHKRQKKKKFKRTPIQASTAGEAIEQMIQQKKISNKLDYDVLKRLGSGLNDTDNKDKESHKQEEALKRAVRAKPAKNVCSPVVPQHLKERLSAFIPSSNKWKDSSLPLDDMEDISEVSQTSTSILPQASSSSSVDSGIVVVADPEIVQMETHNDNEEFEEEDDGEHDGKNDLMSAAKLLGYGEDDDDYYEYQDDYDDC